MWLRQRLLLLLLLLLLCPVIYCLRQRLFALRVREDRRRICRQSMSVVGADGLVARSTHVVGRRRFQAAERRKGEIHVSSRMPIFLELGVLPRWRSAVELPSTQWLLLGWRREICEGKTVFRRRREHRGDVKFVRLSELHCCHFNQMTGSSDRSVVVEVGNHTS